MLTQEESNSVAQELSDRIRAYKRKRPNLSSQNIAKRFGMSASTFNRIENLDIKTPTFEQIVRVLSGTGHDEDLVRFVENKFPHLSTLLSTKYGSSESRPEVSDKVRGYLLNSRYTRILSYVLCKKKLTRTKFKEEFGNDGLILLDELMSDNIVTVENGILSVTNKYHYVPDVADLRSLLINLVQTAFDIKGVQERKSASLISIQVKSLNAKKVLPILNEKLVELYSEFDSMVNNPDFSGDDPIYLGLVMDTLCPNRIYVKEEVLK